MADNNIILVKARARLSSSRNRNLLNIFPTRSLGVQLELLSNCTHISSALIPLLSKLITLQHCQLDTLFAADGPHSPVQQVNLVKLTCMNSCGDTWPLKFLVFHIFLTSSPNLLTSSDLQYA